MSEIIVKEIVDIISLNINEVNEFVNIESSETIEIILIEVGDLGVSGLSAYELAVNNGFVGTESEWITSITLGNIDAGIIY
jgi:hypothetical protein